MIKKCVMRNVKGVTAGHGLGRLTVFVGGNAAGKTARLDAIALGLTGKHPDPDVPETAAGAMMFASADEMEIELELTSGELLRRTWRRTPKGIRSESRVPEGWKAPSPIVMRPERFIGLTAPEQKALLLKSVGDADDDASPLFAQITGLISKEPVNDEVKKLALQLVESLSEDDYRRYEAGKSVSEWLPEAKARVQEAATIWSQELRSLRESMQSVTRMAAQHGDARWSEEDEKRLKQASLDLAGARKALESIEESRAKWESAVAQIKVAQAELERMPAVKRERETLLQELAALKKDLAGLNVEDSKIENEYEAAKTACTEMTVEVNALKEQIAQCERQRKWLEMNECPCCGNVGEKCRANAARMQEVDGKLAELTKELARKDVALKSALRRLDLAREKMEALKEANRRWKEVREKIADRERRLSALENALARESTLKQLLERIGDPGPEPKKDELEAKVKALDEEVRALEDRKARAEWKTKSREVVTQKEARAAVLEMAVELTKKIRNVIEQYGETRLATLIETACRHVNDVLKNTTLAGRPAWRNGMLGVERNGVFAPLPALSGSEKLMVTLGVACMLAGGTGLKVVLLDDVARLERGHRRALVENLSGLLDQGVLDQVIATDWDVEFWAGAPGGAEVIEV